MESIWSVKIEKVLNSEFNSGSGSGSGMRVGPYEGESY